MKNPVARRELEEAGVTCRPADVITGDLSEVPADMDYVVNFSVVRSGSWNTDLDGNAGAVLFLMEHCRKAKAFLHCSTAAVYEPEKDHVFAEGDPLGDNHRPWGKVMPFLSTYSISKIAAEAAARYGARRWNLPTVIARLGVPYGDNGGWPAFHLELLAAHQPIDVHPDRPNRFNPIHEHDIAASLQPLLAAAEVPPVVVNWGGQPSSLEEWCEIMGGIIGIEPTYRETHDTIAGVPQDTTKLAGIVGPVERVTLKDGLRSMVSARRPDLVIS